MQSLWKSKPKEKKLAERKAKRQAKEGTKISKNSEKTLDTSKPITLDFITNPEKE